MSLAVGHARARDINRIFVICLLHIIIFCYFLRFTQRKRKITTKSYQWWQINKEKIVYTFNLILIVVSILIVRFFFSNWRHSLLRILSLSHTRSRSLIPFRCFEFKMQFDTFLWPTRFNFIINSIGVYNLLMMKLKPSFLVRLFLLFILLLHWFGVRVQFNRLNNNILRTQWMTWANKFQFAQMKRSKKLFWHYQFFWLFYILNSQFTEFICYLLFWAIVIEIHWNADEHNHRPTALISICAKHSKEWRFHI